MNILVVSESFITRDSLCKLFTDVFQPADIKVVRNLEGLDNRYLSKLDFTVIDVQQNNIGIVETLSNIKNVFRNLKVMVLDSSRDIDLFLTLTKMGIDAYIIDVSDKDEFIYITKKVIRGKKFYDSELLQYVLNKPANKEVQKLTKRELDVLRQVANGLANKDIANNLGVTDYTIKKHVSKILSKLNLRNRQDIVIYARGNNMLDENGYILNNNTN